MLNGLIVFIHVIVSLMLIIIVLLQSSKGGGLGGLLSGAAESTLGVRGSTTFFHKLTVALAIVFMISSLSLAYISARGTAMVDEEDTVIEDTRIPDAIPEEEPAEFDQDIEAIEPDAEDPIDIDSLAEELDEMLTDAQESEGIIQPLEIEMDMDDPLEEDTELEQELDQEEIIESFEEEIETE